MERSAMRHPNALPALMAISTTARLSDGSAPGRPRHTWHTCVLGGAPNAGEQPQKIFDLVRSCAWTSSPMTGSKSPTGMFHQGGNPVHARLDIWRQPQQRLFVPGLTDAFPAAV